MQKTNCSLSNTSQWVADKCVLLNNDKINGFWPSIMQNSSKECEKLSDWKLLFFAPEGIQKIIKLHDLFNR